MRALFVRPEADADIGAQVAWYELRDPGVGLEFLDEVGSMLSRLREGPLQFPQVHVGVRRALLDRFPFALYFLYPTDDLVVLIAGLHQRSHRSQWVSRLP